MIQLKKINGTASTITGWIGGETNVEVFLLFINHVCNFSRLGWD
jgi:hypothetical protein